MKTKTLLFICLLIGVGLTQLSAQNGNDGTGVVNITIPTDYWLPVYSDGNQVGDLGGVVKWHAQFFYKDGILVRVFSHIKDIMVENFNTGEIFKCHELLKTDLVDVFSTDRFNLIGDQGTHYIGYMTIHDWSNDNPYGILTIEKVIYPKGPK
jgi:hypothetical protein